MRLPLTPGGFKVAKFSTHIRGLLHHTLAEHANQHTELGRAQCRRDDHVCALSTTHPQPRNGETRVATLSDKPVTPGLDPSSFGVVS